MGDLLNAVTIFDKQAERYEQKNMDTSLYHAAFDLFCDAVATPGASVLEVACGPGNITRYLMDKRPDFRILGTDLAPNMLELARKNNPGTTFQLMDCRDIGKLDRQYDALVCGFVFPYLSRPDVLQFISDAARLLVSGGIFYLSTMEDDYGKSGLKTASSGDQVYMYYHESGYLIKALEENGFHTRNIIQQPFPDEHGTTDLIIIAQR